MTVGGQDSWGTGQNCHYEIIENTRDILGGNMNFILIALIVILDKATKLLAIEYLQPIRTLPVIEGIFHLTYHENRGAAFGILQGQRTFFLIATTIVLIAITIFMYKYKKIYIPMKLGLNLIVAGAIGNLIDRVRFGFVVDFFDFRIWPVFNIADSAVVVGAILVSYVVLKYDHFEPANNKPIEPDEPKEM